MNGKQSKLLRRRAEFSSSQENVMHETEYMTKILSDGRSYEVVKPIMWKAGSFREQLKAIKKGRKYV